MRVLQQKGLKKRMNIAQCPIWLRTNMSPESVVQEQLDAYNASDLERFVATYAPDVSIYQPPSPARVLAGRAALSAHYAANRFNLPALHAQLVHRIVLGNRVIDHDALKGLATSQSRR
jgi:hypothetical protein